MKIQMFLIALIAITFVSCNGNVSQRSLEISKENRYLKAIELGGEWFQNNQNEYFLHYSYLPFEKKYPSESHPLREMGAMWSTAKLSNLINNSKHRELAERGFSYFEQFFAYNEKNDFYYVNITSDIKLGYSAFTILSLLEIKHPKKDFYLNKFANGIIFLQRHDGSLSTFFFSNTTTGIDYYPGEALLAMMSLYEYDQNKKYLKVVEKAFPYYLKYWKNNSNAAFVLWQTQAYYKFYKVNPKEDIIKFIFEMNDFIIDKYSKSNDCNMFDFSEGIVIAVRIEGMNYAYKLAKDLDDKKRLQCYGNFIKQGSKAILELQFYNENNFV